MAYSIHILPAAWDDLRSIQDYYILNFSVETAFKVTDSILDRVEQLSSFPHSGSAIGDEWLDTHGYQKFLCGKHHVTIYRIIDQDVYIYGFFDTRSEYTKIFLKNIQ